MNKPTGIPQIAFIDLLAQRRRLGARIDEAVLRVIDHGGYIMGPEVKQLEADLSAFCGAKEVVSCSNGTDALTLVLRAQGVGPGDAVLCPSFTFAATAEVVALAGATPVFVDIDAETFNMNGESLKAGVAEAARAGLKPVAVIPVDLFGLPADYDTLLPIAEEAGLWVLSDAAQSFGGVYKGRKVGTFGVATSTSFFPAKPLGCYGDGGAIFTDDAELAAVMRSLRVHGQGSDKYDNVRIGINGRLDTVQAAILIEKLKIFPEEIEMRDRVARRYNDGLRDVAVVPETPEGSVSTWAQYTLRVKNRDAVAADLKQRGVPTAVYYPKPLHLQTAYRGFPVAGGALPVSEQLATEVISLPMHPYLEAESQDWIIDNVADAIRSA
ncbi:MAG TPA: DegT/DnrJ/EryC1/StrS family aminotransferase [Reyranella sp.]|nr:DegT/DnrJ/EryC1/StrS family aminotransferase [Reyranella sp.]